MPCEKKKVKYLIFFNKTNKQTIIKIISVLSTNSKKN